MPNREESNVKGTSNMAIRIPIADKVRALAYKHDISVTDLATRLLEVGLEKGVQVEVVRERVTVGGGDEPDEPAPKKRGRPPKKR